MCLYNTSFPLESVIVAVGIVEPNLLCAFSSPSFRFPFFSFLNIFPEQFSPQALDRAEKCREEREREWQRQRERAREEEREAEDYKATSLKGNLVQSLNKDKRKLNSEGAQPRCLGELGEHRAGKRSDVVGQPTQGEEEIHVGGRSNRMEAGVGWAGCPCTPIVESVNLRTRCEWRSHRGAARPCVQAQVGCWGHTRGSGRRPGCRITVCKAYHRASEAVPWGAVDLKMDLSTLGFKTADWMHYKSNSPTRMKSLL